MGVFITSADSDGVFIADAAPYDLTGDITMVAWIRSNTFTSTYNAIFAKGNRYCLRTHDVAGTDYGSCYLSEITPANQDNTNVAVDDNTWHMCAAILDQGSTLYTITDDNVVSAGATGSVTDSGYPVYIGYNSATFGRWDGYVADVRLYGRALSLNEIAAIYAQGGSDRIIDGLVSRWRILEGYPGQVIPTTGTPVVDETGTGSMNGNGTPDWSEDAICARRAA